MLPNNIDVETLSTQVFHFYPQMKMVQLIGLARLV